jgi:hypothetical protein
MAKETATEYLFRMLDKITPRDERAQNNWNAILNDAKKLERYQIEKAFIAGRTWNMSWHSDTYFIDEYMTEHHYQFYNPKS